MSSAIRPITFLVGCLLASQAYANPIAKPPENIPFPWGKCCIGDAGPKPVPWGTVQSDVAGCVGDLTGALTSKEKDVRGNPDALGYHSEDAQTAYESQTTYTVPEGKVVRIAVLSDDDSRLEISGGGLTAPKVITTPASALWSKNSLLRKDYAIYPGTYTFRLTYHNHTHWVDKNAQGQIVAKDVDGVSIYLVETQPIDVTLEVSPINTDGAQGLRDAPPVVIGSPLGPKKWAANPANTWPANYTARACPFLYIGETATAPRMLAKLDLPATLPRNDVQVSWRAQTTYKRLGLATDSGVKEDADQDKDGRWDVGAALCANRLYGGEGAFDWVVRDLKGEVLCGGSIPYAVRGKNPTNRAAIRTEVDRDIQTSPNRVPDTVDMVRNAMDAIVQVESGGKQFNWFADRGPTDTQGQNQQGRAEDKPNGIKNDYPVHNPNHSEDLKGIGLTQYTWGALNADRRADVTWDWKKNLRTGTDLLTGLKAAAAVRVVNLHRTDKTRANGDPEPTKIPPGAQNFSIGGAAAAGTTHLSNELATAIKLYNGAGRNPISATATPEEIKKNPTLDDWRDLDGYTSKTATVDNSQEAEQIPVVFWNHAALNPQTNTMGMWQLQTETTIKDYVTEVLNHWPQP